MYKSKKQVGRRPVDARHKKRNRGITFSDAEMEMIKTLADAASRTVNDYVRFKALNNGGKQNV